MNTNHMISEVSFVCSIFLFVKSQGMMAIAMTLVFMIMNYERELHCTQQVCNNPVDTDTDCSGLDR